MVDLLKGSRTTNLYSISLNDMMSASPVCLLTKASSTKSWLWHRRLNQLISGLERIARNNQVRGLPMRNITKDHLCPCCQLVKSRNITTTKAVNTILRVLHTLHMDLYGPMRTESINGKKYVLVIVDDYTRFGWLTECVTSVQTSSGLAPQQMTSVTNSTELELTSLQSGRSRSAPSCSTTPVNVPAAPAPEIANGSPSTTVISEGGPAVTENLLPHQIPLPDTSDSDVETLFDHVSSMLFDT
ncbi:retrovirus-related pol polyprotein from transposon TNT 1-94 [Tanacetum coccineum]